MNTLCLGCQEQSTKNLLVGLQGETRMSSFQSRFVERAPLSTASALDSSTLKPSFLTLSHPSPHRFFFFPSFILAMSTPVAAVANRGNILFLWYTITPSNNTNSLGTLPAISTKPKSGGNSNNTGSPSSGHGLYQTQSHRAFGDNHQCLHGLLHDSQPSFGSIQHVTPSSLLDTEHTIAALPASPSAAVSQHG